MRRLVSQKLRFLLFLLVFSVAKAFPLSPACFRVCPRAYRPICGSDGRTYGNACLLEAARCGSKLTSGATVYAVRRGFCGRGTDDAVDFVNVGLRRENNRLPVWRSSGGGGGAEDSGLGRFAKRLAELRLSWGDPVSNRVWQPVAAAGGGGGAWWRAATEASRNKLAREQKLKLGSEEGDPKASSPSTAWSSACKRGCPKVYSPVCGSDGVTYFNSCRLSIAHCDARRPGGGWGGRLIVAARKGRCDAPTGAGRRRR